MDTNEEDERNPLLADNRAARPSTEAATSIAAWTGALRAGRLPSNTQLYAALHRIAGILDGLVAAASSDTSRAREAPSVRRLARTTTQLLQETAALSRDVARFVTSSESEREGGNKVPLGNAHEQLQRFIWHASRAQLDVRVDTPELAEVKQATKEAGHDVVAAGTSVAQLVMLLITSPELRIILSDAILLFRDVLADAASLVEDTAASAGRTTRPTTEQKENGIDLQDLSSATQDKARELADDVRQGRLADTGRAARKGLEAYVDEKTPDSRVGECSERIRRILLGAQENPEYSTAVSTLLALGRKYYSIALTTLDELSEAVPATAEEAAHTARDSTHITPNDDLYEALQAGREVLEGLAGESLEPVLRAVEKVKVDVREDDGVREWLEDLAAFADRTLASVGMAGEESGKKEVPEAGKVPLAQASGTPLPADGGGYPRDTDASPQQETSGQVPLSEASSTPLPNDERTPHQSTDFLDSEEAKVELNSLVARGHELLRANPAWRADLASLSSHISTFRDSLLSEPNTVRIRSRFSHVGNLLLGAWGGGLTVLSATGKDLLRDLLRSIIPSFADLVRALPIPRTEFVSDEMEASVDDLVLSACDLVPDNVRIRSQHEFNYTRTLSAVNEDENGNGEEPANGVDSAIQIHLQGLRLAARDISFYVKEKYTAPPPGMCAGFCGMGGYCGGGPAQWFAYRENALLDVGFDGEHGIGVDIDLVDAGAASSTSSPSSIFSPFSDTTTHQDASSEDDEENGRQSFFVVRDVRIDMGLSFDFALRQSHHWLLNALIRPLARPIIRLVLERVARAQVQHAFESADRALWDLYSRAKRVGKGKIGVGQLIRVLIDGDAGKSQRRRARERREREEERREAEEGERRERQPEGTKTMKVTPSVRAFPFLFINILILLAVC